MSVSGLEGCATRSHADVRGRLVYPEPKTRDRVGAVGHRQSRLEGEF